MSETAAYLEKLVQETEQTEIEVIAQALRTGLRQLWREWALGRYLRNEISREEAIEIAGIDWVDLAERQHAAMLEDVAWGLEQ
jgi:hypothetical protein